MLVIDVLNQNSYLKLNIFSFKSSVINNHQRIECFEKSTSGDLSNSSLRKKSLMVS